MNYLRVEFELSPDLHEFFIAELMDLDFYGFEQFDDKLVAYIDKQRFNDSNREYLEQLISAYSGDSFLEFEEIPDQNWNEAWEQTIQPQRIGALLVKPTWSTEAPSDGEILLEIDPKMSFGTGYHATTRLMLRQIQEINLKGKRVLDAGTGTGILAIAAVKLGAKKTVGFDNDPWSRDNARENTLLNQVDESVEIRFGGIETVDELEIFDVTLANINRNVLLEILPTLVNHTREGGIICLSGLLDKDEDVMRDKVQTLSVQITAIEQEDEWILMQILKNEVKE
ncbi:50S ribosomal protein L11 methyltransferase [Rhodohalobacter sp. 614A]|uniref:50S ribosomal protein L11 methyltransferase n=1 Tax=Rhodohalobacter sp. 614A TaxID=2908649 RepID=UPI001F44886B|nr:50S ribosomal protein L11 methyltransferase [Rhodohalobacter sp. 614A]